MAITLESKARQMQVFNLPHDIYCKAAGHCRCEEQLVTTLDENPLTGERTPRSTTRRIPASLTLLAGARTESIDEAVLKVPEIQHAIARGAIRVRTEPTTAAEAAIVRRDKPRSDAPRRTPASTGKE